MSALRDIAITAEDIPLLNCNIDIVRFLPDSPHIPGLSADELVKCPDDAAILSLAEQIIANLAAR